MNAPDAQTTDLRGRRSRVFRTPGRKAATARRVLRELGLVTERELEQAVRANLAFSWRYYGRLFLLMVRPLRRLLRATVHVGDWTTCARLWPMVAAQSSPARTSATSRSWALGSRKASGRG
jgi:hypothetical protein